MRAARPAGAGGQVDPLQAQLRHPRGHGEHGALRAGRGRPEGVRLHLGLLLRLVYRADQDPPPGGGRGQQAPGPAGTDGYKRLILSHHKNLNKGDFLIDDRLKNGAENFGGELILFGSELYPNWDSVVDYLISSK